MLREIVIYISAYIGLFAVTFYFLNLIRKPREKPLAFDESKAEKITIIIPAFNEEKGIAKTIESALSVDYPKNKLEIIVVDDGSRDRTFEIASKFKNRGVRVFRKKVNGGKGAAINLGIKNAKGSIIFTMDADNTIIEKKALRIMAPYFQDKRVMCVAPIMAIYKPKGVLQRVQQIEYLLGVFLRKSFANMNAVHITPGAFSAYRKEFFDKYGGFEEHNLTEDLEIALRIQSHHYMIQNTLNTVVFTVAPNKFNALLKQRRRWYTGLMKNFWKYKNLFSRQYGALGTIVLPTAIVTVIISVFLTLYLAIRSLIEIKKELILLESVNFNFLNALELNKFVFERFVFNFSSDPISLFFVLFTFIVFGYMIFARRKVKEELRIKISFVLFSALYAFLFAFWWIVSIFYVLLNRKVSWR